MRDLIPAPSHRRLLDDTATFSRSSVSPEAYTLDVAPGGCQSRAASAAGFFYAEQTRKSLKVENGLSPASPVSWRIEDHPAFPFRGVHVDLKLHPPRYDWMLRWLDRLAAWKINALVLEYEDCFPYEAVPEVPCVRAWTPEQIATLNAAARDRHIEVIPLVQCLGHLEYVLRHEAYAHLRELPDIHSQCCPRNPGSLELFQRMAGDVLKHHPQARYLHVGGDETAFLAQCERCAGASKLEVYLEHVGPVLEWVTAQGVRPLLWDDILRSQPEQVRRLPSSTVLVYWQYGRDRSEPHVPAGQEPYAIYREAGYDVIMAPCMNFGGLVPAISSRAGNIRYMAAEAARYGALGLLTTQWGNLLTPLNLCWHGLAVTAEVAWHPTLGYREQMVERVPDVTTEFDRRFCRAFLGAEDDSVLHALRLMDTSHMYWPEDGRPPPTYYSEPFYVDTVLLDGLTAFQAFSANFFRPDWANTWKGRWPEEAWARKVEKMRSEPDMPAILDLLARQEADLKRGLLLLERARDTLTDNEGFIEGCLAGGWVRLSRIRYLRGLLGTTLAEAAPLPRIWKERLEAFHARSLPRAAARQFTNWMTTGLTLE